MIGFKIRKLREESNISREQMADVLGISLRTYQKIETNEREPALKEVEQIAEKLEVTPIDHLQYNEPKMIFEKCSNQRFYNSGTTIHFQDMEAIHHHYQETMQSCRRSSPCSRN